MLAAAVAQTLKEVTQTDVGFVRDGAVCASTAVLEESDDACSPTAAVRRVTFVATEGIFALRFGTQAAYDAFADSYREKLFENTFKVENDETNRDKVALSKLGAFSVCAP